MTNDEYNTHNCRVTSFLAMTLLTNSLVRQFASYFGTNGILCGTNGISAGNPCAINAQSLKRLTDLQLRHPRTKGVWMQAKPGGCAIVAADAPVALLQDI